MSATARLRGRRDTTVRSGVVVLFIAGVLLYWAFVHHLPFLGGSLGPTVRAEFAEASNLNPRTPVRIDGVNVGKVVNLAAADHGRATIVTMTVGRWGGDIHRDATAQITMRTIVSGAMFINLHAGSTSSPPLGDRVIPMRSTSTQVDYDQFTGVASAPVRSEERQVIKGLAQSLGDPAGIRTLLTVAPPAIAAAGTASDALRGQDIGDLPSLISNSARAIRAIDAPTLGAFIDGASRTFAATADQSQALGETLADTPAALTAVRSDAGTVDTLIERIAPLARQLLPGARALSPAARALRPTLVISDAVLSRLPPLLRAAPAALAAIRRASELGTPTLNAAAPVVARLNRQIVPWLDAKQGVDALRNYEELGPVAATLDSAQSDYDANGYYIRYDTHAATNSVLLPCDVGPGEANAESCLAGVLSSAARRGSGKR